jgi:hypothetical protein
MRRTPTPAALDVVVVTCAVSAGGHAALVPEHVREALQLGAAFVVSVVLLGWAVIALRERRPRRADERAAPGQPDRRLTKGSARAQHRLTGKFVADARDYDAVHRHILEMADMLSDGIMKQLPQRFR